MSICSLLHFYLCYSYVKLSRLAQRISVLARVCVYSYSVSRSDRYLYMVTSSVCPLAPGPQSDTADGGWGMWAFVIFWLVIALLLFLFRFCFPSGDYGEWLLQSVIILFWFSSAWTIQTDSFGFFGTQKSHSSWHIPE